MTQPECPLGDGGCDIQKVSGVARELLLWVIEAPAASELCRQPRQWVREVTYTVKRAARRGSPADAHPFARKLRAASSTS